MGEGKVITFYSYKGGTGRTMALANTAWILAANGKRVLTIDWDLESPGLHKFFRPFLDPGVVAATSGVIDLITTYQWAAMKKEQRPEDWHVDYARVEPHAVSLDFDFPGEGTLDFISAGRQNRDYSSLVSSFDWDTFYERQGGGRFFKALRADMKACYDYVFIDSRTGLSDIADICTIELPDILVDCFTLSDQGIDGASSVARHIEERYPDRAIRILPVPMRIELGEKEKCDAGRSHARRKFEGFPKGMTQEELNRYWGAVEIPYTLSTPSRRSSPRSVTSRTGPARCWPPSNGSPRSSPTAQSPRSLPWTSRCACATWSPSPAGRCCTARSSSATPPRTACGRTGSPPSSNGTVTASRCAPSTSTRAPWTSP